MNNWMCSGSSSHPNVEMHNQTDQKRGYQWLLNASEQELFLNKKQATELVKSSSSSATANLSDYLWYHNSIPQPGVQMVQTPGAPIKLFVPFINPASRNLQEINFLDQFGNDPLNRSCTSEDHNALLEPKNDNFTLPYYVNAVQNKIPSYGKSFNGGSGDVMSIGRTYNESGNVMPIGHTYSNDYANFVAVNPYYNRVNEENPSNGLGNLDCIAMSSVRSQLNENVVPLGHVVNSDKRTILPFGGIYGNNHWEIYPSESRVNSNYANHSFSEGVVNSRDAVARICETASNTLDMVEKNKEKKKNKKPANENFPVNVKSLLATGFLDGIPVKYVSWSREKSLRGVVKGLGYLCSCAECKFSKSINAYEFELHAGCKTKHPNNHIYFQNGKSIYAVVLELKATPRDKLFDVIQNVTGSTINQKLFLKWKASYQAENSKVQGANERNETNMSS